jgi:cbb3-type cytochrome oxidase maturation protein
MTALIWLIPIALAMGFLGLMGFLWSLKSGQFEDLDGAAERILMDDDKPLQPRSAAEEEAQYAGADDGDGAKSL